MNSVSSVENTLVAKGLTMSTHQQSAHGDVPAQIRRILASRLKIDESVLTDDFRWLAVVDAVAEEEFLADVSDTFTVVPLGLSFGSGRSPFEKTEPDTLETIATVGGLIAYVEQHLARCASPR